MSASSFEEKIEQICALISINKEDRKVYTEDFCIIRNYILDIMKEDPVFKSIFGGDSLFGSYLDNIKIGNPDEFDDHIKLKPPNYNLIKIKRDSKRPGFIQLNFRKIMKAWKQNTNDWDIYEKFSTFLSTDYYLDRWSFNFWLKTLIEDGLMKKGYRVQGSENDWYNLQYSKRGTAHTIFAYCSARKISIDLVPAFVFERADWIAKKSFPRNVKTELWFAVPKPTVGPKKSRRFTFSICAPQVERDLILNRMNLKKSLRLLKALRDRNHLPRLKSYFLKTVYLWENDVQSRSFWNKPTGEIFLHMLDRIIEYFEEEYLPFYWDEEQNLLDALDDDEISSYTEELLYLRDLISTYTNEKGSSLDYLNILLEENPKEYQKFNLWNITY